MALLARWVHPGKSGAWSSAAAGTNIRVEDATVTGNSFGSTGVAHGLVVTNGVSGFQFVGNRCGPTRGATRTRKGMEFLYNTGASNSYIIDGNDCTGNVTGGVAESLEQAVANTLSTISRK